MERMSYELARHLSDRISVKLIKFTRKSDSWLPIVYLLFLVQTMLVMLSVSIDAVYLNDAALAPLGVLIKKVYGLKVFVIVHGLDITYPNPLFQRVVSPAVSKMDKVICVSSATQRACTARGVPVERTVVIPNGASDCLLDLTKGEARRLLGAELGIDLCDEFVILSVGRLVERKGFHWFASDVMPELIKKKPNARYVIVGNGPAASQVKQIIAENRLGDHVTLLTGVDNRLLKLFYNSADVFVAPNVTVRGDMEGFGLVLLEAGSCGLPVVGTDIEGPSDVIKGFGRLVPERDVGGFVRSVLADWDGPSPREYVLSEYSWSRVADRHLDCIFQELS